MAFSISDKGGGSSTPAESLSSAGFGVGEPVTKAASMPRKATAKTLHCHETHQGNRWFPETDPHFDEWCIWIWVDRFAGKWPQNNGRRSRVRIFRCGKDARRRPESRWIIRRGG